MARRGRSKGRQTVKGDTQIESKSLTPPQLSKTSASAQFRVPAGSLFLFIGVLASLLWCCIHLEIHLPSGPEPTFNAMFKLQRQITEQERDDLMLTKETNIPDLNWKEINKTGNQEFIDQMKDPGSGKCDRLWEEVCNIYSSYSLLRILVHFVFVPLLALVIESLLGKCRVFGAQTHERKQMVCAALICVLSVFTTCLIPLYLTRQDALQNRLDSYNKISPRLEEWLLGKYDSCPNKCPAVRKKFFPLLPSTFDWFSFIFQQISETSKWIFCVLVFTILPYIKTLT